MCLDKHIIQFLRDWFPSGAQFEQVSSLPVTFIVSHSKSKWFVKDFADYPCIDDLLAYEDFLSQNGVNKSQVWTKLRDFKEYVFLSRLYEFSAVKDLSMELFFSTLKEVENLHQISSQYNPSSSLVHCSAHYFQSLNAIKDLLVNELWQGQFAAEIETWLMKNHQWVKTSVLQYPNCCKPSKDKAILQHGDLHIGNVLRNQNTVCLIDFEEFYKAYDSPLYDLSGLYVRFYLPLKNQFKAFPFRQKETELIDASKEYALRLIFTVLSNSKFRTKSKGNWVAELDKFQSRFNSL